MATKRKKRLKKKRVLLVGILGIAVIGGLVYVLTTKTIPNDQTNHVNSPEPKNEMESLYFYDKTRLERYQAYQNLNPQMSVQEVVWRVNVDIDQEDYTNMTTIQEAHGDDLVLLVNKHFRLSDDYEPRELELYNGYLYMTPETLEAFEKMRSAALLEELDVRAGSTYRSVDYQRDLYNAYVEEDGVEETDKFSARAGSSEHHTGRAIDLVGPDGTLGSFENTREREWVHQHAHEYGFILRYQEDIIDVTGYGYEPWHITYIGPEAATTMHEKGIASLEEYYVKYIMYQPQ